MTRTKYLYILLVIAMFLWGSSWPTSKILANYTDTSIITFWRFFFVVLGSFFVLNFLKIPLKIEKTALKWVLIAGVLNGLYAFVFFIAIKHGLAGKGGVLVTTMIPIFSYLIFMIGIFFDVKSYEIFHFEFKFWISMFVVAFLSTIIGTSIYYYGIHILGSVKANSFVLITPASALICSYFILDEVPNALTLLGCALAIGAIYFINIYGKKA